MVEDKGTYGERGQALCCDMLYTCTLSRPTSPHQDECNGSWSVRHSLGDAAELHKSVGADKKVDRRKWVVYRRNHEAVAR